MRACATSFAWITLRVPAKQPVAADVVDVQVRVDERRDVGDGEAAGGELRRDRLLGRLLRQLEGQHAIHVIQVDARVEEEQPLVVLDQHAVDRDA